MKAKEILEMGEDIKTLDLESLEKIRNCLLKKQLTQNVKDKLVLIDIAIEEKHRRNRQMEKMLRD